MNCVKRKIRCSAEDKTYRDGRMARQATLQGEDVFPISLVPEPFGLPNDDRLTAQDALYLEYFDSKFIRGRTERIHLRYVSRSGDEEFVPVYGFQFVGTSKPFRYGILALASFLKEKGQGDIIKHYKDKFHGLIEKAMKEFKSTKFPYDMPYAAYAGFVFSCISEKRPIEDIFCYALAFATSIYSLRLDTLLDDNQRSRIRQMWLVCVRMLHHEHLYALEAADVKTKFAQYRKVASILRKGEFMLGLGGERTLFALPSTEEGAHQRLGQISTYMQFSLEYFLFRIHHDCRKEIQEELRHLDFVHPGTVLLNVVKFSSELPDVEHMIERAAAHCSGFERSFETFETFAYRAYEDLDFGGSLDPDSSREKRHLALALICCSASLLLTQLRPIDYSHKERALYATHLCHLCLHPCIDLRLAARSLFWAGLAFAKLKHEDGSTYFLVILTVGNRWIKDAFEKLFQGNLIFQKENERNNKESLAILFQNAGDLAWEDSIFYLRGGNISLWEFNQRLVPWYENVCCDDAC